MLSWLLHCPPVLAVRRIARPVARRRVLTPATVAGTGVVLPRPQKYIREGGPACTWELVSTADAPLYGGPLPPDFTGLPLGYASAIAPLPAALSPALQDASDYAAGLTTAGALLGGITAHSPGSLPAYAGLPGLEQPVTGQPGIGIPGSPIGSTPGQPVAVSEPTSLILFASGLVALAYFRSRRHG